MRKIFIDGLFFFFFFFLQRGFSVALDTMKNNNKKKRRKSSTGKTLSIEKYVGFNEELSTVNNVLIKVESVVIALLKIRERIFSLKPLRLLLTRVLNILLSPLFSLYKFHRKSLPGNVKELPGITIIKPLTGIDGNLYENLKTFFNLQYPRVRWLNSKEHRSFQLVLSLVLQYEILFCLQEDDPELTDMLQRLRVQYPRVESQLFVRKWKKGARWTNVDRWFLLSESSKHSLTGERTNPYATALKDLKNIASEVQEVASEIKNPKIFNMLPAYEKAQYPLILVSDSGLMMHENTLYDMALCMTDTVGLVHQMPFTCDRKGFAGSVEKVGQQSAITAPYWQKTNRIDCCLNSKSKEYESVDQRKKVNMCTIRLAEKRSSDLIHPLCHCFFRSISVHNMHECTWPSI